MKKGGVSFQVILMILGLLTLIVFSFILFSNADSANETIGACANLKGECTHSSTACRDTGGFVNSIGNKACVEDEGEGTVCCVSSLT